MAMKDWKKIQNNKLGGNISIIYKNKKKGLSLELFRDSTWGKTDNMNVIVRNINKDSLESSLGMVEFTKHFDMESQAQHFAKAYMKHT